MHRQILDNIKYQLRLNLIFCGLMLWVSLTAHSYDSFISVKQFDHQQGLLDTTVFSLGIGSQGFMWLGTPNALVRYDGHEFMRFSQSDQNNFTLHMSGADNVFFDSQGRLWIGTWGDGLAIYDQSMNLLQQFRHYRDDITSLPDNKIQVIFEDRNQDIWIGTNGGGLALYQPQTNNFIRYTHDPSVPNSISHNRVWSINQNNDTSILIGTGAGLDRLDLQVTNRAKAPFERVLPKQDQNTELNFSLIRSLYTDKQGRLWIASQEHFGWFDTEQQDFHLVPLPSKSGTSVVNCIAEDHQGNILIGTHNGLYRYLVDKQQLGDWPENQGYQLFPQRDIRDVITDHHGVLWVATRYAGLIRVEMGIRTFAGYRHYQAHDVEAPINRVYQIYHDETQRLWLASAEGLLYKDIGDKEFRYFELPTEIQGFKIVTLVIRNGKLWLGGRFGLYSLHIQSRQLIDQNQLLADLEVKHVAHLFNDSQNNLWIGTDHHGVIKHKDNGTLIHYRYDRQRPESISGNSIIAFIESRHGHIWIATFSSGLNRFDVDTGHFYRYKSGTHGLPTVIINDVYEDSSGDIWVATPKGLSKLDTLNNTFISYDIDDNISGNGVMAIIEDDQQGLWVSHSTGLARFDQNEKFYHYITDIKQNSDNRFLRSVVAKVNEVIYFGGTSGVNYMLPEFVISSNTPPKIALTNISVDDQALPYKQIYQHQAVHLEHDHRYIRVEFSTLDFLSHNMTKYKYKLEGFDDTWRKATMQRQVNFNTLQPGEYQLKVLASANDREWTEQPLILPIHVSQAWWQVWWFKFAVVLLIIYSVWYFYHYRQHQLQMNAINLEQQISQRTWELNQSNRELADTIERLNESQLELVEQQKMASLGHMVAGIAHEVNTPLGLGITASTLLQQRIDELKTLYVNKKLKAAHLEKFIAEGNQNTDIIFNNLEKAASLIHGFKQVAVDQSNEGERLFRVNDMLEEIMVTLSPKLKTCNHILTYRCMANLRVYSKPGALSQILFNLINNSLIHAFTDMKEGLMTIDVSIEFGKVKLVYRDNGCGLDDKAQKQIYEPFITTKRSQGNIGLGMHLVYNLVSQGLGGSIKLKSALLSGVEYTIIFPVDSRKVSRRTIVRDPVKIA